MKRSNEYWQKRFLQLQDELDKKAADSIEDIQNAFTSAQRQIEKEIDSWYVRFAKNNEISLADAKKWLTKGELKEFKWDVNEYIKRAQEGSKWAKELENASARVHISRLEELKLRMQDAIEVAYNNQEDKLRSLLNELYSKKYYKTAYEVQKGTGIGFNVSSVDPNYVSKVLARPWAADELNFSDRIWKDKATLIDELNTRFTKMCILGEPPDKLIEQLAKRMRTSKSNAGRLVMTESAFIAEQASKDCFDELDVEKYEILAVLDSKTSEICRDMDGKVFDMKDYKQCVTAPPFHVWCRTTKVPYIDDDYGVPGKRAARGKDGKTYYVPDDMTYKEWAKEYVNDSTRPQDKKQYERYKAILGNNAPDSLDGFMEIKYNNRKQWSRLKELVNNRNSLQERLDYAFDGVNSFVPNKTKFASTPKVIAGAGSDIKIRTVEDLIEMYGGNNEKWAKKVAKINSVKYTFDVHWYEMDGIQYDMKVKSRKVRR